MSGIRSSRRPADTRDEFTNVFQSSSSSHDGSGPSSHRNSPSFPASQPSSTPASPQIDFTHRGNSSSSNMLSEQQLYDRIEEQLEQLDKKRLMLQQLFRSFQETPYSSRISRSIASTRTEAAKLAKKIHNLLKVSYQYTHVSTLFSTRPQSKFASKDPNSIDPGLVKFQPLFQNYAAVSRILNAVCVESVRFEDQLSEKGAPASSSPATSAASSRKHSLTDSSHSARRRHQVQHQQQTQSQDSNPYDALTEEAQIQAQLQLQNDESQQQQQEHLPLLQVNGLDTYDLTNKQGDYMHLQSMVMDLAQSFSTLQELTRAQQEQVDLVTQNIEEAKEKAMQGEEEIRKASRYKAFGLVVAGGVTGAAIGGPLGALVGLKTGVSIGVGIGLMGVGGAMLGAAAGKQIQKARFVPLSHLDEEQELATVTDKQREQHYKNEQQKAAEATGASSSSSSTATTRPSSAVGSPAQTDTRGSCLRKCL